ncbi:unnamed protein product [Didymodactylos carnosus]|uniref:UvrABC system protein B n=1 Tax=Didymodactylos carnosus TaxID=1234261 RepID=A0A8S2CKC5_9BILA|nr:unnamed protein product [Didymodactylos carnosus]CAF3499552.1 unnamed protein product [Didymodactylos carnosus]
MSEDMSQYLKDKGFKVAYLHNELKTLERAKILNDLRRGKYDILVGINLLREGLDIPEVTFVAILDADKEGFLRNNKSLIQIIGRAARNEKGRVVMYAAKTTKSMQFAIDETNRRRALQIAYNQKHGITPATIIKGIRDDMQGRDGQKEIDAYLSSGVKHSSRQTAQLVARLRREMMEAAKKQEYERASELRDMIIEIEAASLSKTKSSSLVKDVKI